MGLHAVILLSLLTDRSNAVELPRHSTYCPRAFELANHFAEWTGFECDYARLPTTSTRRDFIHEYLQTHHDIATERHGAAGLATSPVSEAEVDQVMADVDMFRGFPGFYW